MLANFAEGVVFFGIYCLIGLAVLGLCWLIGRCLVGRPWYENLLDLVTGLRP